MNQDSLAPQVPDRLGIIAGAGLFPRMVLDGAQKAGCRVTVVGLRGLADRALLSSADEFRWANIARLGRWIRILRGAGARRVILAGSVKKSSMYGRWRMLRLLPDWTAIRIWFWELPDKRNDTVLRAVARLFARNGITMQDCVAYNAENLAGEGVLTLRQPSPEQMRDATFGWRIAKELGRLDIGQSVAVKETEVIAVEAIEGTDRMIERAGSLCRKGGWVLVKTAKPNQDMRFDVPTVGPDTIAGMARHGAAVLVVEAGKTLIINCDQMLADAAKAGIVVVSLRGGTADGP